VSKFNIEGLSELEATLAEFKKGTAKGVVKRALIQSAAPMVEAAKRNAPVDRGDLRDSYAAGVTATGAKAGRAAYSQVMRGGGSRSQARAASASALQSLGINKEVPEVYVGSTSHKAHLQEFGTVNHPAQPHFRPAVDETIPAVVNLVGEKMAEQIEKTQVRLAKKAAKLAEG